MKSIFITLAICLVTKAAYATSQVPEVLIYDGVTNDMYSTPLDSFFTTNNPMPRVFFEHPSSTACWRSYVGTWKIEEGVLYLVSLCEGYPRTASIPLNKVDSKWISPVAATWFTGEIRIGKGEVLMGGMGFSETRATDIFLQIKDGKVVSTREVDNTTQDNRAEQGGPGYPPQGVGSPDP